MYLCDYDDSNLAAHKQELNASWPAVDIHTRQFDAGDDAAVQAVVDDAMQRYGRLDVFFANAGTVGPMAAFTDVNADEFMDTMRVNSLRFVPPPPMTLQTDTCTCHPASSSQPSTPRRP